MHEISIVRSIFSTLEAEFSPAELERLSAIELQVGLLANVEPQLLHNAFEAVTSSEGRFQQVRLQVELVPIEVHCAACDALSLVEQYKFACARCGRPSQDVRRGTELLIQRVHFEEADA